MLSKMGVVNAKDTSTQHPVTKVKGVEVGREIHFPDKKVLDRDLCASINIAIRRTSRHPTKTVNLRTKNRPTPKRAKNVSTMKRGLISRTSGVGITVTTSVIRIDLYRFGGKTKVHGSIQGQQSLLIPSGVSKCYRKVRETSIRDWEL